MFQFKCLFAMICLLGLAAGGYHAVAQDEADDLGPPMMGATGPMMDDQDMPPPPQDHPRMKLMALNRALQDVDLTDQQRQQIQDIRKEHRQAMEQWRKDHELQLKNLSQKMKDVRQQHEPQMERSREMWRKLRALLESDVTGADLEKQVTQLRQQYRQIQEDRKQARQQMQTLHDEMHKLMATAPSAQPVVDKILDVLTAEQRTVVEKRMKEIEAQRPPMMAGPGRPGLRQDENGWHRGPKDGDRPYGPREHRKGLNATRE